MPSNLKFEQSSPNNLKQTAAKTPQKTGKAFAKINQVFTTNRSISAISLTSPI
jgi:hypothetical protein